MVTSQMKRSHVAGFVWGTVVGWYLHDTGKLLGLLTGLQGVRYYSQAHTKTLNKIIHCLCMPCTFYGMSHWVPAAIQWLLSKLTKKQIFDYKVFNYAVIGFYWGHYLRMNPKIAIVHLFLYGNIVVQTIEEPRSFTKGILTSTTSLGIQELLGHWLSGDIPSRFQGVVNAILYANYYATTWDKFVS